MPKLKSQLAKKVNNAGAATGSYLLPEGRYAARLLDVEQREGAKAPYWRWKFGDLHNTDGESQPGKQWNNTSLSEKALGFLKATFEAFGYTTDSDTDEMIGEWVTLHLVQEQIATGNRAGEMTNSIQSLHPFNPDDFDFDPAELPAVKGALENEV